MTQTEQQQAPPREYKGAAARDIAELETIRSARRAAYARFFRGVGYVFFFLFSFLLFAYWTFPYERLRDFIVQEVERPKDLAGHREPSGTRLAIDELSPSWLTGIHLEGVRMTRIPRDADSRPLHVNIDELDARISILPLLVGKKHVSYDVVIGDGELEGDVSLSDDDTSFELDVTDLDLHRLTALADLAGIPIGGTLNGHVAFDLPTDVSTGTGEVNLVGDHLTIGDGHAKLQLPGVPGDGLSIGRVDAGQLHLEGKCERGLLHLDRAEAHGRDLELRASGNLRFATPLSMSRLDLLLKVKFSDAYRNRDDHTRALFTAMDMFPQVAPAKTPDGALQYQVGGPLAMGLRGAPAGSLPMR